MSKAKSLIESLSPSERKQFGLHIKKHRRPQLQTLFRLLIVEIKRETELDKEHLFRKIFGIEYSQEKDYLLRNEFRILVKELYKFLVKIEALNELEKDENYEDTLLLKSLFKRKCFDELESLLLRSIEASNSKLNFDQASRQVDIYFQYLIFHREITPTGIEGAHKAMCNQMGMLKKMYRTKTLLNQNNRAMCEAMLKMSHRAISTPVSSNFDIDFSGSETAFSNFLQNMLESHVETNLEEKIRHVQNSLDSINPIQDIFPADKTLSLATLATLYYIKKNYAAARKRFEEALDFSMRHNLPVNSNTIEILHNYVSTLMRLTEYEKALLVLKQQQQFIQKHHKLALRFLGFACYCHIFLNQPNEAFQTLPQQSTYNVEYEHLYFRFIYAIIPFLRLDIEAAHRESVNLCDYFLRRHDSLLFAEQQQSAQYLRKFYTALLGSPDRTSQKLQKLKEEIQSESQHGHEHFDSFFMTWLLSEIQKRC